MKGVAGGTPNFFLDALPDEAFCRLVALPPPRFVELLASSRNVFGWCGQVGGRVGFRQVRAKGTARLKRHGRLSERGGSGHGDGARAQAAVAAGAGRGAAHLEVVRHADHARVLLYRGHRVVLPYERVLRDGAHVAPDGAAYLYVMLGYIRGVRVYT